jgi:hypothetical protein
MFPWILLITMAASFILVNFVGPNHMRKQIIDGDGSGYYAYLPALFIYQSADFTPVYELEKKKRAKDYQGHYFHRAGEKLVNKYTTGTAMLQLPFFLMAYVLSLIFGLAPDGYNILFQYGVALAAFFYVFLGLMYLKKLADLYEMPARISIPLVFVILLGTNLFYYSFFAPSMSHAYSFSLIAIFIFLLKRTFINYSAELIFVTAFLLGLIMLVRPVNAVVVLAIPFLASSPAAFLETIRKKLDLKDILITLGLFILALSPQLMINYLQTEKAIVFGYTNEGFYWLDPEAINFLFSYRKGWFTYTPVMLLTLPALYTLFKKSAYLFITFVMFLIVLVYVFSSWWNWLYGDSFGMRPMIDFYAIFFVVICLFIERVRIRWIRYLIGGFAGLAVLLNLFQTWQYSRGIIHADSMNKEAYWYVFLKSGQKYVGSVGDHDEYYYGYLSEKPFLSTGFSTDDKSKEGWTINSSLIVEQNQQSILLDAENIYSPTYAWRLPESLWGDSNIYLIFGVDYREVDMNAANGSLFVVDISDSLGNLVFYKTFKVKRLPGEITREWKRGSIGLKLPEIGKNTYRIKCYIWNKGKQKIYFDRFHIDFHRYGLEEG